MYYKVTNNLISADLEIIQGGGAQLILVAGNGDASKCLLRGRNLFERVA